MGLKPKNQKLDPNRPLTASDTSETKQNPICRGISQTNDFLPSQDFFSRFEPRNHILMFFTLIPKHPVYYNLLSSSFEMTALSKTFKICSTQIYISLLGI